MSYPEVLSAVNVSSKDNGYRTTDPTRRRALIALVAARCPQYELLHDGMISLIFKHKELEPALAGGAPLLLISSHLDEVYPVPCFHVDHDAATHPKNRLGLSEAWRGTFDNSSTNAAVLEAMRQGALPPSALVAFEGNEEGGMDSDDDDDDDVSGRGVYEVMAVCKHYEPKWGPLALVVVLDVTPFKGGAAHYTLENYFAHSARQTAPQAPVAPRLRFPSKRALLDEALRALPGTPNIDDDQPDAGPDSSWDYDEHQVNVLSLCMPVMFMGRSKAFDDRSGQIIFKDTPPAYIQALVTLTRHMSALPTAP